MTVDPPVPIAAVAHRVATALAARAQTVALAESSSGGLAAAALAGIAGASAWFVGSVVPYSPAVRMAWLGVGAVPDGAVSAEMAVRLAEAVRERAGATWGVGETGVAGPQLGRRSRKVSGTAFVAVAGPSGTRVERVSTGADDRVANQSAFALAALALLVRSAEDHCAATGTDSP